MAHCYLEGKNIRKSFATKEILHIDAFSLYEGDRIGLVGENGAGKSTLLKILAGELEPDSGYLQRYCPVSYIRQFGDISEEDFHPHIASVFQTQEGRNGLSGGEKTRRRIAAALSQRAHVLLADEPTTDLDTQGIALLKEQLLSFSGALLLVSHDRQLLNDVCRSIIELRDGKIELFPGNYKAYQQERARRMDFARFEYNQYRAEQSRLKHSIQGKIEQASKIRKTPTRMGNSEARLHKRSATEVTEKIAKERKSIESRLAHLEKKERVRDDPEIRMALGSATSVISRTILTLDGLSLYAGDKQLLHQASALISTGSVTAVLGPNGCGKTTLVRRILQNSDIHIRLAPGAKIGLFGQDHAESIDLSKTALENVLFNSSHSPSDAHTVLARLQMRENEIHKPCGLLSGGERAKVSLAALMLSNVNFLILDEPTNHLDIYTTEALQQILTQYSGTVLLVSHDVQLINAVSTDLLLFENCALTSFHGNLSSYQQRKQANPSKESETLSRSLIEMRMAALSARLAKPRKGDNPQKLNEEYQLLIEKLQQLQ